MKCLSNTFDCRTIFLLATHWLDMLGDTRTLQDIVWKCWVWPVSPDAQFPQQQGHHISVQLQCLQGALPRLPISLYHTVSSSGKCLWCVPCCVSCAWKRGLNNYVILTFTGTLVTFFNNFNHPDTNPNIQFQSSCCNHSLLNTDPFSIQMIVLAKIWKYWSFLPFCISLNISLLNMPQFFYYFLCSMVSSLLTILATEST